MGTQDILSPHHHYLPAAIVHQHHTAAGASTSLCLAQTLPVLTFALPVLTPPDPRKTQVKGLLRDLRRATLALLGEEADPSVIDSACERVFATLWLQPGASRDPGGPQRELSAVFPQATAPASRQAVAAVDRLQGIVDEAEARADARADAKADAKAAGASGGGRFGSDLAFSQPFGPQVPIFPEHDYSPELVVFPLPERAGGGGASAAGDASASAYPSADSSDPSHPGWLRSQIEPLFPPEAVQDMTLAVYEMLESSKSDDQLQNELFELLGFDRFDLIQQVLQARAVIIQAVFAATEAL